MIKRKGFMKKGIAIVATALTVVASASTILAYEPFVWTDEDGAVASTFGELGAFSDGGIIKEIDIDEYDFSISDILFIYEDGTQVAITEDASPHVLCNHTMTSGYYSVHSSNSSGGCTVYVYNAQRCTKCGYIDVGSLHSTTTYPVCPH